MLACGARWSGAGAQTPSPEQAAYAAQQAALLGAAATVQVFGPRVVIPIATKGPGINGSGWFHRLFVGNPGGQTMDLRIVPSPGSSSIDPTTAPGIDVTVAPHETLAMDWPSDQLYPNANVAYQIFNTTPNPNTPLAMVRIFNRRPDGTELSQTVVGHTVPEEVLRVGDKVRYFTERKDGSKPFRDNWFGMGLRDPTQPSTTRAPKARFALYRADGALDPTTVVQNFGDGGRRQWTPVITVLGYPAALAASYDAWEVTCVGGMIDGVVMNIQTSGTDDGGSQQTTVDRLIRAGSLVTHTVAAGPGGGTAVLHALSVRTRPGDGGTPPTVIVKAQLDYDGDGTLDETVTGDGSNELTHAAETDLPGPGAFAAYAIVTVSTPFDGTITRRIDGNTYANSPPDGAIVSPAGDLAIRQGDAVAFAGETSDPDGDEVSAFWSFGDGGTSHLLVPGEHVFASPGVHLVTFTATDAHGFADPTPAPRTNTLAPNEPPDATIDSPAGDLALRLGDEVDFAGSASDPEGDPVTVLWDFGDGGTSSALVPGAHSYAGPGEYVVTLAATDSRGAADPTPATRTVTVAANQPPIGTITTPAGDVSVAPGVAVSFAGTASDPEGDAVTVLWSFGDGGTSTALAPGAHSWAAAGVYTVTLTATDSFGLPDATPDTRTVTVTANNPPQGSIVTPATSPTVVAGQSVAFSGSASDPDGDAVTVLWSFGDGVTSTAASPSHAYLGAGAFTVTYTVTDSHGTADPTPATRLVTVVATATLTVLQSQIFNPICSGCHPANADLDLRAGVTFGSTVNVASFQQPPLLRIKPGDPDESYLYRKVNGGPGITGVRMPRFQPALSQEQRDLIRDWILAGALDN